MTASVLSDQARNAYSMKSPVRDGIARATPRGCLDSENRIWRSHHRLGPEDRPSVAHSTTVKTGEISSAAATARFSCWSESRFMRLLGGKPARKGFGIRRRGRTVQFSASANRLFEHVPASLAGTYRYSGRASLLDCGGFRTERLAQSGSTLNGTACSKVDVAHFGRAFRGGRAASHVGRRIGGPLQEATCQSLRCAQTRATCSPGHRAGER